MSQGKRVDMTVPIDSVEKALIEKDWTTARYTMAIRLARMFDSTDSAREVKALCISLDSLIDKCKSDFEAANMANGDADTPLADILKMAANG